MATAKRLLPEGGQLQYLTDGTFRLSEPYSVTGLAGATEDAQLVEALTAVTTQIAGTTALLSYTRSITYGGRTIKIRPLTASAKLLMTGKAAVTVEWGQDDSPVLDGPWIVETYSDSVREMRGLDVNGSQITVRYVPETMMSGGSPTADWSSDWNQRRYNRGISVPGFVNRPHIIARRQISAYAAADMNPHPYSWPSYYVDYVNDTITSPSNLYQYPSVAKGVFRCSSVRVYTRSKARLTESLANTEGGSFFVEAEFIRDPLGHDPIALFYDTFTGSVPTDIDLDGMTSAWPTYRASQTAPYGASRPQMVKGATNFKLNPFNLDLRPFNQVSV